MVRVVKYLLYPCTVLILSVTAVYVTKRLIKEYLITLGNFVIHNICCIPNFNSLSLCCSASMKFCSIEVGLVKEHSIY